VLVGTALLVVALGLALQTQITSDTPLWYVELILVVQGLGMGNVMAPATNAVMGAIPRDKAGAGSAVNNTIRQVGGALGVAVLGSVLSSAYRSQLGSAVDVLPAGLRQDAAESIGGTYAALGAAGPRADALASAAREAFLHAMHVTALCAILALLLGSAVVWVFLPGRRASGGSVETGQHEATVAPASPGDARAGLAGGEPTGGPAEGAPAEGASAGGLAETEPVAGAGRPPAVARPASASAR
jgi:DHA2 family integral membrane protein (MFS transporter)